MRTEGILVNPELLAIFYEVVDNLLHHVRVLIAGRRWGEMSTKGNHQTEQNNIYLAGVNGSLRHIQVGVRLDGHGLVGVILANVLVDLGRLEGVSMLKGECRGA